MLEYPDSAFIAQTQSQLSSNFLTIETWSSRDNIRGSLLNFRVPNWKQTPAMNFMFRKFEVQTTYRALWFNFGNVRGALEYFDRERMNYANNETQTEILRTTQRPLRNSVD